MATAPTLVAIPQPRTWEEGPQLPRGCVSMFPLVFVRHREFQRQMARELERRRLGPFAPRSA